jgi:hypothetical protein
VLEVFDCFALKFKISSFNVPLTWTLGFGMMVDLNVTYYVADFSGNTIYILNDEWKYLTSKSFPNPAYMVTIDNNLYIICNSYLYKTDKYLNKLDTYQPSSSPSYRGIYYNSTSQLIYTVGEGSKTIEIFNLNLSIYQIISVSSYTPRSIIEYDNELYVGTSDGSILLIVNQAVIRSFNGCGGNSDYITSLLFDQNGILSTLCDRHNIYSYNQNGTLLRTGFVTASSPQYKEYLYSY